MTTYIKMIRGLCSRFCRAVLPFSLIVLLAAPSLVPAATPTGDPATDPIPILDFNTTAKAMVVNLYFTAPLSANADSVKVVNGPAAGRQGAAPMLNNEVYDVSGNLLDKFYAWHPLMIRTYDASGLDHARMLSEGSGIIVFPYKPDAATLRVSDIKAKKQLVSVDLVPAIHQFCRNNRSDLNCPANVVNRPPVCNANGPYVVECAGQTTNVKLDGTKCSDPDGDPLTYAWSGAFGSATGAAPTVQYSGFGQSNINLAVSDDFGGTASCISSVSVVDTTPPTIQSVTAKPNVLWPPDHKMVPVKINVASSDICDPVLSCKIVSVSSNEPLNGLGDGDMAPDWEITGDQTLNLRAERSGTGKGRTYTVTATCSDTSGNSTSKGITITVPRDQRK